MSLNEDKTFSRGEMINFARWCMLDLLSKEELKYGVGLNQTSLSLIESILKERNLTYQTEDKKFNL